MLPIKFAKADSPSRTKANKKLGQHFLHNQQVIKSICRDFSGRADAIVEVGPGPGALTGSLAEQGLPFFVIEKDSRFVEGLEKYVENNHHIYHCDALKFSWTSFIESQRYLEKKLWLVSNLPYNVGVPLFIQFTQVPQIQFLTLMFQKEVALKILGGDMGSLMVLAHNYFEVTVNCQVGPGSFTPPPKVQSTVLSFERKSDPVVPLSEFAEFEIFLRALFQFKRKYVSKGLLQRYSKEKIEKALELCHIHFQSRAESLSVETVVELYQTLRKSES